MKSKHTSYYRLLEELQRPGCALCRLGGGAANRFLDALLYEYVNDTDMRRMLVASYGFCATHSVALAERHDALGSSILYRAILSALQEQLQGLEPLPKKGLRDRLRIQMGHSEALDTTLTPQLACPACSQRDEAAVRALEVMTKHGDDPEFAAMLQKSDGFCLPHLRLALKLLHGAAREQLLERQQEVWQALRDELAEAIRKHDYRFHDEGFGAEEDAWRRAVEATAGSPGVF